MSRHWLWRCCCLRRRKWVMRWWGLWSYGQSRSSALSCRACIFHTPALRRRLLRWRYRFIYNTFWRTENLRRLNRDFRAVRHPWPSRCWRSFLLSRASHGLPPGRRSGRFCCWREIVFVVLVLDIVDSTVLDIGFIFVVHNDSPRGSCTPRRTDRQRLRHCSCCCARRWASTSSTIVVQIAFSTRGIVDKSKHRVQSSSSLSQARRACT